MELKWKTLANRGMYIFVIFVQISSTCWHLKSKTVHPKTEETANKG